MDVEGGGGILSFLKMTNILAIGCLLTHVNVYEAKLHLNIRHFSCSPLCSPAICLQSLSAAWRGAGTEGHLMIWRPAKLVIILLLHEQNMN